MTRSLFGAILLATASTVAVDSGLAQHGHDPDWPCIQRKVPQLSLPQVWTGPPLPEQAARWSQDDVIAGLVARLSQRRVPMEEAQAEIRLYAESIASKDDRDLRLFMLVRGLFDRMNRERSEIISGIGRYARKQAELAAALRAEQTEIDAMHDVPQTDAETLAGRTELLTLRTRIFQERVQSLTYVCEVPRLIERRLYQLAQTINEIVAKEE